MTRQHSTALVARGPRAASQSDGQNGSGDHATVAGEQGSRDPRGFALTCYTEDGNGDMVANNTPIFVMKDPMKFQHFIRSQKRIPGSELCGHDMQWGYWTLSPESAHMVTWLAGDRGIPKTRRHMNGYSSHSSMWVDADGEKFYVEYHVKTDQGVDFLTQHLGDQMAAMDTDFPVDVTTTIPHRDYPPYEVGRRTLDRNPTDFFTEIEEAAFDVASIVPGTGPSPDRTLQARVFSYSDAHRYGIGPNDHDRESDDDWSQVLERAFWYWRSVDESIGQRIKEGVPDEQGTDFKDDPQHSAARESAKTRRPTRT